jgi:hypothetical protein
MQVYLALLSRGHGRHEMRLRIPHTDLLQFHLAQSAHDQDLQFHPRFKTRQTSCSSRDGQTAIETPRPSPWICNTFQRQYSKPPVHRPFILEEASLNSTFKDLIRFNLPLSTFHLIKLAPFSLNIKSRLEVSITINSYRNNAVCFHMSFPDS